MCKKKNLNKHRPKVAFKFCPFCVSVMTAPFLKLSSSLCDPLKLYMAFTRVTPATPDILKREEAGTAQRSSHFVFKSTNYAVLILRPPSACTYIIEGSCQLSLRFQVSDAK